MSREDSNVFPLSTTPAVIGRQRQQDAAHEYAERQQRLFDWAEAVLEHLGLVQAIERAKTIAELHRIELDLDSTTVILAINEARRDPHFRGLTQAALKKIIKNRFADLLKDREKKLLGGGGNASWVDGLTYNKQGRIEGNLSNFTLLLRHSPEWKGVLGYSEFSGNVIIRRSPPWGYEPADTVWTRQHTTKACVWFLQNDAATASKEVVINAVEAVAREQSFHPVRDYFDSLVWDGVARLDRWLPTYFHTEDSEYVRAVGPRWLISAVARIYKPGCKVDHTLVLEGPQGRARKSSMVRALVPKKEWFTDQLSNVTNKDALMQVAGVLVIELAEMEVVTRASSSAMKRFLTHDVDRFRPPYGRELIKWPRQCVFIGTMNPVPGEGYLKDPTGARRFWPVKCVGQLYERDIAKLEEERHQLWAEAVHRYKAGKKWWLETPELEALATAEQEKRRARDDGEEPVREWVGNRTEVTIQQVLRDALGLSMSHSAEIRVQRILKHRLGFRQARPNTKGVRHVCYRRE
jgi:predicted P-loop ATPase